jgi:trehalose/maltose hydrolase-like predicted phosphorylase
MLHGVPGYHLRDNVTIAGSPLPLALPAALARRFEAVVFDWDGTAVPDRNADAGRLRGVVEALCGLGMDAYVVTGTHVGNVDEQLAARPRGPGRLHLCVNRGSEVFRADEKGIELIERRVATDEEDARLDAAADATVSELAKRGVNAEIVSQRLNRRKIDLIPGPEWQDPPKARIGELLTAVEGRLRAAGVAGIPEAVQVSEAAARSSGLEAPRVTSDAKHVEIGLTDKADAARWVFRDLWRRGVSPRLVLVAGDEFGPLGGLPGSDSLLLVPESTGAVAVTVGAEPTGAPSGVVQVRGGPEAFLALLEDQLARRTAGVVPDLAGDEGWTMSIDGFDPELERFHEALLVISDGSISANGAPAWTNPSATPRVLAAGVYDGEGPETELLPLPIWHLLGAELPPGMRLERVLDLRTGTLRQTLSTQEGEAAVLGFLSAARPGTFALRATGPADLVAGGSTLRAVDSARTEAGRADGATFMRASAGNGGVAVAAASVESSGRLERLGCYVPDPEALPDPERAATALADVRQLGFETLLGEQRGAWAERWEHADVVIRGDEELQLAVRFALFHLMASTASEGEAAVGARGLTGPGYRGHVFWDTDVFVLPFLAATHAPAARAILEYRIRRLPVALRAARSLGLAGARFPWESARDGVDVTPPSARDPSGKLVRIRTGEREEHIVADVAWAASTYVDWTGDDAFAAGAGLQLLVETARYWASRARFDRDGRAHIYSVIGPDEYHEPVDDNAYTNVMARWNLRKAAEWTARFGAHVAGCETERWLDTAAALVDGLDASTGIYEEFAGFNALEALVIADLSPRRPIAADLLLGHERVAGAQVVKQADVLMLHHLVPEETTPGSLHANLDFYEPRTAHGSSLSPAVHASLLARAGHLGRALQLLRIAAMIDLEDLTGTTAGGLHLATMGGVWQALAFGFAGLRPRGETLVIDPRLPDGWDELRLNLVFRGARAQICIRHDGVKVDADRELRWEEEDRASAGRI